MRGILISHILLSQKLDPMRCKSYTLIKMCKCVEFSNPNIFDTPLIMTFSLLNNCLRSMGYFSFFNTLEPSCVPFFFFFSFAILRASYVSLFFQYSPILFLAYENFGEKDS